MGGNLRWRPFAGVALLALALASGCEAGGGSGGGGGGGGSGGGGGGGSLSYAFTVAAFSPDEVAMSDGTYLGHLAALDRPLVFGRAVLVLGQAGSFYGLGAGSPPTLRRMKADSFHRATTSAPWQLPATPEANDTLVSTPGCAGGVQDFVVQQGDGDVLYSCAGAGDAWYDTQGTLRFGAGSTPLAWNAANAVLLEGASSLLVQGTGGSTTFTVSALPPAGLARGVRPRAQGDGFWVVSTALHRWSISAAGVAEDQGAFAEVPAGITAAAEGVLDGSGSLFTLATDPGDGHKLVLVRPLAPALATIAHDYPSSLPAPDLGTTPPTVLTRPATLVTGP